MGVEGSKSATSSGHGSCTQFAACPASAWLLLSTAVRPSLTLFHCFTTAP